MDFVERLLIKDCHNIVALMLKQVNLVCTWVIVRYMADEYSNRLATLCSISNSHGMNTADSSLNTLRAELILHAADRTRIAES
jgi:hypothetical protein